MDPEESQDTGASNAADAQGEAGSFDHVRDDAASRQVSRRQVLRGVGMGGAAVVGGGLIAHQLVPHSHDAGGYGERSWVGGISAASAGSHHSYGDAGGPPTGMAADALDAVTIPPPFDGRQGVTRTLDLAVTQRQLLVADGVVVDAWTYGGTAPGPILRATEGDRLQVRLVNQTSDPHNLHLHGRHDPAMDGWEPIAPGDTFTYDVIAAPFGVHPYHCHVAPLAEHVARGLYGTLIVDPPGGRPDAHEVVLVLGGWDLDGDGRMDLTCWNGVAGFFATHPIRVPVGELVRVYLVNMLEHEPIGSFHLHAQTFDVYRSGTSLEPHEHTDTITLGQGERAILEFTLPAPGRYMFHPHQHHLADRGAMGWFAAV
jgi:nitrite reductase (NO-forming)